MAEKRLTREEIRIELLWCTDTWGNDVWQEATQEGILDILQKTWEWVEKKLTP